MSIAGAVYLSVGWLVYALDPARSWVCLPLFGMALLSILVDGLRE